MSKFIELPAVFSDSQYSAGFAQDLVESGVKEESLTHIDNLIVNVNMIIAINPTADNKGCTLRLGFDEGAWKIAMSYSDLREKLINAGINVI